MKKLLTTVAILGAVSLVAAACGDSKKDGDSKWGGGGAAKAGESASKPVDSDKKPETVAAPAPTPGVNIPTPPAVPGAGDDPTAAAADLAAKAAELAKQASGAAAATAATVGPMTNAQALVQLEAVRKMSCACTERSCGVGALNAFSALYQAVKNNQTDDATYKKVTALSSDITKCLMGAGLSGDEIMAIFKGDGTAAAPATPTAPTVPGVGVQDPKTLATNLEGMATEACTCQAQDKACGTRHLGKLAAFYAMHKDIQADQATLKRVEAASAKFARCLVQAGIDTDTIMSIFK